MADMQLGHSVDLEEVFGQGAKKQNQLKTLECNDECKIIERNRKLALGLQIVNPDLSGKLMPRYSDYMKQWAKKDPQFCQMIHEKLTELVQLAKTSKQKSRSYSFDVMNREKRHFVHESCEHFGCESQAYDEEPKRNVVATAVKDKVGSLQWYVVWFYCTMKDYNFHFHFRLVAVLVTQLQFIRNDAEGKRTKKGTRADT